MATHPLVDIDNGKRQPGRKMQRRLDRLTGELYALRAENQELHEMILKYEQLLSKCTLELRKAKAHGR